MAYQYQIYYPEAYNADNGKQWPLILFLHGAGERGSNLELVKLQGLPNYLRNKKDFPFVVTYPQCPARSYWEVSMLNNWLEEVLKGLRADPERIYLTGISMGGYGTWHWAAANPNKFAAIIPICGGGEPSKAKQLAKLPIWAFHGAKDNIVPLRETVEMTSAIEKAGGKPKITIYPDLYHDSWTETYQNEEIYDWLLKHKRENPQG